MAQLRTQRRPGGVSNNTWPGFVDALSTLLLVIIFLLSIFMLAQFFLGQALSGKDEALEKLQEQVLELGDLLSLQRQANDDLRSNVSQLSASLQVADGSREQLQRRILELEADIADAEGISGRVSRSNSEQLATIDDLQNKYNVAMDSLTKERTLSKTAQDAVDALNGQLANLRQQLAALSQALEASEAKDLEQQAVISNLGQRLNTALASKVNELNQFRSDFFGKLRQALGDRSDIRIQGDRFIFQSEVLFGSASATLGSGGQDEMAKLATTLSSIMATIPDDVDWILRVDGHTDVLPIRTTQFPSNWDLSTARALSVVKFLISEGIPADRLAATGFGQFHPLDATDTQQAYQRNRRIEMRLDQK
ncbi:MAG: peptidoglycan -binding protein [Kordiimonadaceae bacterium]|jgi:chemotaxis protein MotB|nr:peptidoglycan -binding protein [Kordiimonadaceae bacterium]MBT6032677.1 peptidoglycan -binding protein [Kordiimonadaceae bacterium]